MKTLVLAFTAILLSLNSIAQKSIDPGTSIPMPDLKMKDVSGKLVSIKNSAAKNGVLVIFSCNTCPYVVKNEARTKAICKYAAENNVGVIIINSNEAKRTEDDSYDAMCTYAKKQGYNWKYVVDTDSKLADAFGASRTPEVFLFNKDGILVYKGAIDDNPSDEENVKREHLKEAVNELLAGKEVSVKQSKSVGCTIKRKA